MRLQGAVFPLHGALLDPENVLRPGLGEFLSLLKIEGVWMYLVSAGDLAETKALLSKCGLDGYFRGILTEADGGLTDPELYEKAVRRLRAPKDTVVVFTHDSTALRRLHASGFRTVFLSPSPTAEEQSLAETCMQSFTELICRR